jgi:hypothetical protein
MPIPSIHREMNILEPLHCQLAQTHADGIADDERANERRAADRRAQQHAEMRAPVKAKAANDERPESHSQNSGAL